MDEALIAARIESLVRSRGPRKSICPSEVARSLDPDGWRALMPAVRGAALALARAGRIEISRGGVRLDPQAPLRGAIRLRLPRA